MKREKIRRVLFVSAACLLSFPWLTPCVGIWSAVAVDGAHNSITHRDEPLNRLPDAKLKEWAAKPGPRLAVSEHQSLSSELFITDAEFKGSKTAARSGTLVGKGASALVDGVTYTLTWVDPFTWVSGNTMGVEPTKPNRRLILCESPFVMLEADDLRFTRDGKSGAIRLARATNAKVTVITPDGSYFARGMHVHYRGPSQEVVLTQSSSIYTGTQKLRPAQEGSLIRLNFVKHRVSCSGAVLDDRRPSISKMVRN